MKTFALIFLAVLSISQAEASYCREFPEKALSAVTNKFFTVEVDEFFESFKDILLKGSENLGIPVMDPYEIEHKKIVGETIKFNGHLDVDEFIFSGLAQYSVEKAELALITNKLSISIYWPRLQGHTFYNMNSYIYYLYHLYGAGNTEIIARKLKLRADIYIGIQNGSAYISEMQSEITLGYFKITATGLFHSELGSKFLSVIISQTVLNIIKNCQNTIVHFVNTIVMTCANKFLSSMSFSDLLNLMS